LAPRPFSTPSGISLADDLQAQEAQAFYLSLGISLWKWIESRIGNQYGRDFPNNLISANGRAIVDILGALAGKKIPGLTSTGLASSMEERFKYTYKQYSEILNFLKASGCLLSSVKPEFLLSLFDFQQYVKHQGEKIVRYQTFLKLKIIKYD
jgi:hypothetical protein